MLMIHSLHWAWLEVTHPPQLGLFVYWYSVATAQPSIGPAAPVVGFASLAAVYRHSCAVLQDHPSTAAQVLHLIIDGFSTTSQAGRAGAALGIQAIAGYLQPGDLMPALHFLLEHGVMDMTPTGQGHETVSNLMVQAGQ